MQKYQSVHLRSESLQSVHIRVWSHGVTKESSVPCMYSEERNCGRRPDGRAGPDLLRVAVKMLQDTLGTTLAERLSGPSQISRQVCRKWISKAKDGSRQEQLLQMT